jgi:hypothetical protein
MEGRRGAGGKSLSARLSEPSVTQVPAALRWQYAWPEVMFQNADMRARARRGIYSERPRLQGVL